MTAVYFILGWLASSVFFYAYQRSATKRHIEQIRAVQESENAVRGIMQTTINDMALQIREHRIIKELSDHREEQILKLLEEYRGGGDITLSFLHKLPCIVNHEGMEFIPNLFKNGDGELRLSYDIFSVSDASPHKATYESCGSWYNPFSKGSLQGFLYLFENIETDYELAFAIAHCHTFLKKNSLLPPAETQTNQLPLL